MPLESNRFFKLGIFKASQSFDFKNVVPVDVWKTLLCGFMCAELKIPSTSFIILFTSSSLCQLDVKGFKRFLAPSCLCSMCLQECLSFVSHWRITFSFEVLSKNELSPRAELRPFSGLLLPPPSLSLSVSHTHAHTHTVGGLKPHMQHPISPHLLLYKCMGTAL